VFAQLCTLFCISFLVLAEVTEAVATSQGPGSESQASSGLVTVRHATLDQRLKYGYGANGLGPTARAGLREKSEKELLVLAESGDAAAAHLLWTIYQGEGDVSDLATVRIDDVERLAVDQYRRTGHTSLIYMTALRYELAARYDDAVAWYRTGGALGDPVCEHEAISRARKSKVDEARISARVQELLTQLR
jgi:hypothetical protein